MSTALLIAIVVGLIIAFKAFQASKASASRKTGSANDTYDGSGDSGAGDLGGSDGGGGDGGGGGD